MRELTYAAAIQEALGVCLELDPNVVLMGLGVPDSKGIFGTTLNLQDKYGSDRVFDVPLSEASLTGMCIGMAIAGKRPVLVHQRMEFSLLGMEQLVNQAAKWNWLFGKPCPIVIRVIVGRGWGQGPTHGSSFHSLFASIPGIRVIAPVTPHDAKGMLISAIQDNNPVVMVEHRWLHSIKGHVPEGYYTVPMGKSRIVRTIDNGGATHVACSYSVVEAMRFAKLHEQDVADIIDIRSLSPIDMKPIIQSVDRTKKLVVWDIGSSNFGYGSEIITRLVENDLEFNAGRKSPKLCPCPSSYALAQAYYPEIGDEGDSPRDVPNKDFKGPF